MEHYVHYTNRQKREQIPDLELGLSTVLMKELGEVVRYEEVDGTEFLEGDSFELSYTEEDGVFEIRNLEVFEQGSGTGARLVALVAAYADEQGLELVASNVKDSARGFWQKMGFEEGEREGEFYRVAY